MIGVYLLQKIGNIANGFYSNNEEREYLTPFSSVYSYLKYYKTSTLFYSFLGHLCNFKLAFNEEEIHRNKRTYFRISST